MKPGDRVQLHPATDRWMRGDRYGVVVVAGFMRAKVTLDKSGDTLWLNREDVLPVKGVNDNDNVEED